MDKIIFVRKKCVLGGNETLILRMAKWLIKNKYDVCLICNHLNNEFELENKSVGLNVIKIEDWLNISIKDFIDDKNINNCKIICFNIYDYFFLKLNCNFTINILLYVVHPYTLYLGSPNGKKKLMKIFRYPVYKILNTGFQNNEIIFMDNDCIEKTEKYYNKTCCKKTIVKLPIDIPNETLNMKCKQDSFTILTIARAEFPFKGYILGLIEDFVNLEAELKKIKLYIISSGKDEEIIERKIAEYNTPNIVFLKGCASDELKKYYDIADLYIGMGTTVLLAASYGVPVLLVEPYTYHCNVGGMFNEYPDLVEANPSISKNCKEKIKEIYYMSNDEYIKIKEDTYNEVVEKYGADNIIPLIVNNINKATRLSFGQKIIIIFLKYLKSKLIKE